MKNESWDEAEYWLDRAEKILSHFKFYYSQILCAQKELYEKIGNQTKKSDKNTELLKVCKENGYYWLINNKKSDNLKVIEPNEKRLFIYTLGHFQVYYDKKLISISRNSSLRLLQYLITNRMKKINKDLLLDELFPEGQLDSINNQLHVSLSILRKALEPGLSSGVQSKFIVRSGNHYIFNRDEVYLDIDEFWSLFNSSNERKTPDLQSLKRAEELYKGNFFEEYPYEMFLEAEREKLRSAHLKILRELADHFYEEDDYDRCFQYYENIISKYPYEESIYYEYIVLLLKQNLHLQANSVAKRMVYNMKQELGIDVRESLNVLLAKYNSLQVN